MPQSLMVFLCWKFISAAFSAISASTLTIVLLLFTYRRTVEIFDLGICCLSIDSFSSPMTVAGVRGRRLEESFSAMVSAWGLFRAYSTHA